MRRLRFLLIAISPVALCGCVSSILARTVLEAPNQKGVPAFYSDSPIVLNAPSAWAASWHVAAGPPPAEIEVAAIEPGDYGFEYHARLSYPPGQEPKIDRLEASWRPAARRAPWPGSAKATIVLLHGYLQDKRFATPWALALAQAGYRCAVVDLRGHGASTGKHISFGAFEAQDISAVLDDLARRGWDVSRVGVFGVSYGASVGLLAAGRDPRIRAVVAFQPFASAERAVPELMRSAFQPEARGITDRQFAVAHVKMAKLAGFQWSDADIPAALARTTAPVLFLHGEGDKWLSPDHSRTLARVAPPGSELVLAPNDNHMTLPLHIERFRTRVIEWFDGMSSQ